MTVVVLCYERLAGFNHHSIEYGCVYTLESNFGNFILVSSVYGSERVVSNKDTNSTTKYFILKLLIV
jgi:hypothetical protein